MAGGEVHGMIIYSKLFNLRVVVVFVSVLDVYVLISAAVIHVTDAYASIDAAAPDDHLKLPNSHWLAREKNHTPW